MCSLAIFFSFSLMGLMLDTKFCWFSQPLFLIVHNYGCNKKRKEKKILEDLQSAYVVMKLNRLVLEFLKGWVDKVSANNHPTIHEFIHNLSQLWHKKNKCHHASDKFICYWWIVRICFKVDKLVMQIIYIPRYI